MTLGGFRAFGSPKWLYEITKPLKDIQKHENTFQNRSKMENTWNRHPKIIQKHKSASKMAAKCTQNHSKIDPKSLKINAISENAQNHSRSSPLMRERLEPIKNGAKSQAKRVQKHIKFLISKKHPKMTSAGSQNDSKWIQNASTWANFGATWLQNGPGIAKHGPKCPHLGPKCLHLGPIWGYFGPTLQKAPKMIPKCVPNAPKMLPK
jgi:hypothetical protein